MAKVTIKTEDLNLILEDEDKDLHYVANESYQLMIALKTPIIFEPVQPIKQSEPQKEPIQAHPEQDKQVVKAYA